MKGPDVAHISHVELLTPKAPESLEFFTNVMGMEIEATEGGSVYLRGWGDYQRWTLKLTESNTSGMGEMSLRAWDDEALQRRVALIEASGLGEGWIDGDVGHGPAYRVESRIPGADVNSYIAFAGVIAAGLHGIENKLDPGDAFVGNAYTDPDVEHIPSTLVEAIDLFEHSEIARNAFGEDVHHHILNSAKQEWAAFNRAVTDWELRRNFEQF